MNSRRAAAKSGFWSLVLQVSRFGLNTLIFLILVRWLSPAEIGAFAIAFAPVAIARNTQRGGFSDTIVQGRDETGAFAHTVFWISVAFGAFLSLLLYGASFIIEAVTGLPSAGTYLAAMSIIPLLVAVASIPEGLLQRQLNIRALALRTASSLTIAGLIALYFGYHGYGGWALTIFAIANTAISMVLALLLAGFVPRLTFDRSQMRAAAAPLMYISGRVVIGSLSLPALQLMVGIFLGPVAAGLFQIAQRFMMLASTVTLEPIRFAVLPLLAKIGDDPDRFGNAFLKALGLTSFLMLPVYFGLFAVAPTFLPLVIGDENGSLSVPAVRAIMLVGGCAGAYSIYMQALTVSGRTQMSMVWSVRMLVLRVALAGVAVWFSGAAVAASYSLAGYLVLPAIAASIAATLGIATRRVWHTILAPVASAIVMVGAVFLLDHLLEGTPPILSLIAQVALGAMVYVGMSLLVNREVMRDAMDLLSSLMAGRKPSGKPGSAT